MKNYFLLSLLAVLFISCGEDEAAKRKKDSLRADSLRLDSIAQNSSEICSGGICVTMPKHFIPVFDLHPGAMLQFSDSQNEEYLIIMDDDKKGFLDSVPMMEYYNAKAGADINYRSYWKDNMSASLNNMYDVNESEFSSGVSKIKLMSFMAVLEDVPEPVAYYMAFIEGKTKMYVLTAWTLESQRESHEEELLHMLTSFREQ